MAPISKTLIFCLLLLHPIGSQSKVTPPIQKINQSTWRVEAHAFQHVEEGNMEALLGHDDVEASFLTGDTADITLIRVHSEGLLSQAGFLSGDRITHINDYSLDQNALSIISILQEFQNSTSTIQIHLLRNRKSIVQKYIFEGDSLQDLCSILLKALASYLNPFTE